MGPRVNPLTGPRVVIIHPIFASTVNCWGKEFPFSVITPYSMAGDALLERGLRFGFA
jgi:hypothetical protein